MNNIGWVICGFDAFVNYYKIQYAQALLVNTVHRARILSIRSFEIEKCGSGSTSQGQPMYQKGLRLIDMVVWSWFGSGVTQFAGYSSASTKGMAVSDWVPVSLAQTSFSQMNTGLWILGKPKNTHMSSN